jgi:hypothetical protein
MLVVFARLAPVRPGGGGTLVISGSHRLTTPAGPKAARAPVRSHDVKAHLRTMHPWLRDLWHTGGDTGRIHRYLTAGAVIDGVPVRVRNSPASRAMRSSCIPGCCMWWHPTACTCRG